MEVTASGRRVIAVDPPRTTTDRRAIDERQTAADQRRSNLASLPDQRRRFLRNSVCSPGYPSGHHARLKLTSSCGPTTGTVTVEPLLSTASCCFVKGAVAFFTDIPLSFSTTLCTGTTSSR